MSYGRLLAVNLLRRKLRTALTLGSFGVALLLFGLLIAIREALLGGMELGSAKRLNVIHKVSLIQPLPYAYREKLARVPGITGVTFMTWFGGVYQDGEVFFPQFAIDHATFLEIFPEYVVPPNQWRELAEDKAGCVVGRSLAKELGWKIGDRVPIRSPIFDGTWEFDVRGIYDDPRPQDDTGQFWFRWDYLNEKAPDYVKDYVGWYIVAIDDPAKAPSIGQAIDQDFGSSPWPTRTMTEQAMAASFAAQIGNVKLLLISIGSVVFFTLLLVAGNTMALAVRERTREMAVMKTLGFTGSRLMALVIVEALVIALVGGAAGLLVAKVLTSRAGFGGGMLVAFYLPPSRIAAGLGLAAAVGLAAGLLPALSAYRLRVATALRRL